MRKLLLLLCLIILSAPFVLNAGQKHKKQPAPEMYPVGAGVAAVIGVAGYLVLRKRHARQN